MDLLDFKYYKWFLALIAFCVVFATINHQLNSYFALMEQKYSIENGYEQILDGNSKLWKKTDFRK